jgi:hypothetical protein
MGTVTAHAKDTRINVAIDLLEILPCRRVARQASHCPLGLEPQRILGPEPVVTGHAFVLGKRLVQAILDQAAAARPVRGVARHTVGALHRVTKMRLLRFAVLDGMAGHTQSFTVIFDQVLVIRRVGAVAA